MKNLVRVASVMLLSSAAVVAHAEEWSGKAIIRDAAVPIHLSLTTPGADGSVTGAFINGDEKTVSNKGVLKDGHLVLNFDYFARKLEGDIKDGKLQATFSGARGTPTSFNLQKQAATITTSVPEVSKIAGDWEIAVKSPKGESAWTLRVTQPTGKSREAKAVVLRIDGDTGGLYGGYDAAAQEYRFARFAASGPALYGIKLEENGTIKLANLLRPDQQWTGRRPADARKENLAPPTKTEEQTSVVDPSKPLVFAAPDLASGKELTNADPRFAGKVVIVAVGGSWCPNCHDEAPLLVDLYKRYHSKGLEVVSLSFEEEDQLKDPVRLRAFQAKYGITYPILVAGTPDQLNQKLPQGKNLNCWPTAFFVGRDGLVKEAHAGFAGPATGQAYADLKAETETLIEGLLKQAAPAQSANSTSRDRAGL